MIEIALRFGWIAQTIVVVAAVILVFYKSFYEDWNKKSEKHKKIIPSSNNSLDLGSSSRRWNNLYVNDMHFSNEGKTNDVDGSWGDWTLQEGEDQIYMLNNRNGKKCLPK